MLKGENWESDYTWIEVRKLEHTEKRCDYAAAEVVEEVKLTAPTPSSVGEASEVGLGVNSIVILKCLLYFSYNSYEPLHCICLGIE